MVIKHKTLGKQTYDIYGYGIGEGLMCCNEWEIKELIKELQGVLDERAR